ncbi:helix-turn-helix domain-containing protein [Plastoroseomonas arctica]|uniref:Helix-turn-helix domain-containing protein n=1 Tax=Plastoroseomonas arctica TaxID=1509237 RepID=A0AAF1KL56_9PROT|nr:helix-turn-helix domain-containing protein [Plastoroseomonas arctica]MBR0657465.1 helix-turn-helix domain-containing protein [Plastoroseomonas arctica]
MPIQPDSARAPAAKPRVAAGATPERNSQRASAADHHVGSRIRERRVMMGLSQQQLAGMIGVTYQQAHKYERGLNRISAGRLFEIAGVLAVPVSWFFDGLQDGADPKALSPRQRMGLELARNFALIDNEKHQEALSQMARALAAQAAAAKAGATPR